MGGRRVCSRALHRLAAWKLFCPFVTLVPRGLRHSTPRYSSRASPGLCRPHRRQAPPPSRGVRARSSCPEFGRPQVSSPRPRPKRDGSATLEQKPRRGDLSCTSGAAIPAKPIRVAGELALPLLPAPTIEEKFLHWQRHAKYGSGRELKKR